MGAPLFTWKNIQMEIYYLATSESKLYTETVTKKKKKPQKKPDLENNLN